MQVRLEVVTAVTDELVDGMRALLAQLSTSAPPPSRDALTAVVTCPTNTVLAAWSAQRLVGTSTLVVFRSRRVCVPGSRTSSSPRQRAGFELRDSKVYRLTL